MVFVCIHIRYADDMQCYFSFDRDSSVDMIKRSDLAHGTARLNEQRFQ